jgi:hypothetical protein
LENGNEEEAISDQDNSDQETGRALVKLAWLKLDEEVEGEEEQAEDEEEGAEGEAALGETADRVEEASGDYAEAGFGARKIERPDRFIAGQIAAEGGELVFHPGREFVAITP